MAIGWLTVLKLVPWGEVIKNAPVVADSARKLWDSVGRKPAGAAPAAAGALAEPGSPAALQVRVERAETEIAALHEQMQASSALIKALAEQNTELVRRAESHRGRITLLASLVVVFVLIAGLNLAVTFSR